MTNQSIARVHKSQRSGRKRLAGFLSGLSTSSKPSKLSMRRLLCESLERRYAMHGMAWMPDVDQVEYRETTLFVDHGDVAEVTQVRSTYTRSFSAGRTETFWSSRGAVARYRLTDAQSDAFFEGDESEHERGGRIGLGPGEGEFVESRPALGGRLHDVAGAISTRPEPKLAEPKLTEPNLSESKPSQLRPGAEFKDESSSATRAPASSSDRPLGGALLALNATVQIDKTVTATGAAASTGLAKISGLGDTIASNLFGSSPANTVVRNLGPSVSGSSSNSVRSDLARPATVSDNAPVSVLRQAQAQSVASTSISNLQPKESTSASIAFSQATKMALMESSSLIHQAGARASGNSAPQSSADDTSGLFKQLRSVVEDLSGDRLAERRDAPIEKRSPNRSPADELSPGSKDLAWVSDGLLELPPTTERLPTLVNGTQSDPIVTLPARHRGQLIAALELHREFDLAGQAIDQVRGAANPVVLMSQAKEAAAEWAAADPEQVSEVQGSDSPTETSLWQRSLLSLSFLAIGGMLVHGRRRYQKRNLP